MADEAPPPNPLALLLQGYQGVQSALGADQAIPVDVVSGDTITGDLQLADGSKLRVRLIVTQVTKLPLPGGPGGRPMYNIETALVPSVVEWKK